LPKEEKKKMARFTYAEAKALVGKTFESLIEFSGVPQGTRGEVVDIDHMGDGWDVVIEWQLDYRLPSGQGLRDWFTREEIKRFMREVQDE
jgi:hypothetical protein